MFLFCGIIFGWPQFRSIFVKEGFNQCGSIQNGSTSTTLRVATKILKFPTFILWALKGFRRPRRVSKMAFDSLYVSDYLVKYTLYWATVFDTFQKQGSLGKTQSGSFDFFQLFRNVLYWWTYYGSLWHKSITTDFKYFTYYRFTCSCLFWSFWKVNHVKVHFTH